VFDFLFCGFNLSCQYHSIQQYFDTPKYPTDVAMICQYFEEQKAEFPDYCKWKSDVQLPRKRNEF
jgi:hypothetical protein